MTDSNGRDVTGASPYDGENIPYNGYYLSVGESFELTFNSDEQTIGKGFEIEYNAGKCNVYHRMYDS